MANTGYKQATIAYKVSKPGGEPLDINGQLTRITGRKQAIALLEGHVNPDSSKYEVEFYYDNNGVVTGNPTITYDVQTCPIGYIRITPSRVVLGPDNITATVLLESSNSWKLISGLIDIVKLDYAEGSAGAYTITLTRTNVIGQGLLVFQNIATKATAGIYVVNAVSKPWILETGRWNNLGFWYDNGIWNY